MDWKLIGRAVFGGTITFVVGNYLTKVLNTALSIVPQNLLGNFLGLTPHIVIAYGTGLALAEIIGDRIYFLKK